MNLKLIPNFDPKCKHGIDYGIGCKSCKLDTAKMNLEYYQIKINETIIEIKELEHELKNVGILK